MFEPTTARTSSLFLTWLILTSPGFSQSNFGSISGSVNSNLGPMVGQTVRLFTDDGDGVFEPIRRDAFAFQTATDSDGRYVFDNLDPKMSYFLHSGATTSNLISPGSASRLIDGFADDQILSVSSNNPVNISQSTFQTNNVLGGERDVDLTLRDGMGELVFASNRYGLGDFGSFNASGGVNGRLTITYDGIDSSAATIPEMGLNGIDLTDGARNAGVMLKLGFDNSAIGESLTLRIYQGQPTVFSEVSLPVPITGGFATEYIFARFDDFEGPVDATRVDAIQVIFDPEKNSIDGQIDEIGLFGAHNFDFTVGLVPEPRWLGTSVIVAMVFLAHRRKFA